jgi:drug/metabolite transporter (DMT)-like permease
MSIKQIVFIFLIVTLSSIAQILFKVASFKLNFANRLFFLNTPTFLAFLLYFIASLLWVFAIKDIPLKTAYPYTAISFFLVPCLSYLFLEENINLFNFIGATLIFIGVWVSSL